MVFLSGTLLARPTFATVDFNVSLDPVLQVIIPADTILLDLTPTASGADFTSSDLNVAIGTNNPTGYHFSLHTNSTNLTKTEADNYGNYAILPTLEDNSIGYNETDFTVNRWGYLVNNLTKGEDSELYLPFETDIELSATTGPVDIEEFGFRFGAKVDMEQPAGTYVLALNFNAVANVVPGVYTINFEGNGADGGSTASQQIEAGQSANLNMNGFTRTNYNFIGWNTDPDGNGTSYSDGALYAAALTADNTTVTLYAQWEIATLYMQNIVASQCTSTPLTVVDNRDNNEYVIQKLNDGKCWMMENLRLGSTGTMTLTPANTNITSNYTLPASGTANFTDDANGYTKAAINIDSRDKVDANGSKYGTYYNYCAATAGTYCYAEGAGTGNATADICPKGWRLPTGGASGEFQALVTAYNISNNEAGSTTLQQTLKFPLAGAFYNGSANYQASDGDYWSSTYSGGTGMYVFGFGASYVLPQNRGNRFLGFSVRCVLETRTISDVTHMQDVTPTIAANTPVGMETTLKDNRDQEDYLIGKLADGKLWMLDNLRLGTTSTKALTPSDTNIASNWTLPASGTANFTSSTGYTTAAINASYKDNTTTSYGNGSGKVGVYYNYCAATAGTYCYAEGAGTGNASYDICPKNWRMPTGGSSGEYQALYTAYSSNATNFRNALSTPLSGYFYTASQNYLGSDGGFWSSTYGNTYRMYGLFVNSSNVNPAYYGYRYGGFSVRCVLK